MNTPRLVYMANQIAAAFAPGGDAAAVTATEDHLRKFWDKRMKRAITEHLANGGEGLGDIARSAVGQLTA